jgi:hypothetical protein
LKPTAIPNKGKEKASELEDIEFPPPPPSSGSRLRSSTSIREEFDDDDGPPISQPSPPSAVPKISPSSRSSESRQSTFSFEQIPKATEANIPEPVEERPRRSVEEESSQLSNESRAAVTNSSVIELMEKNPEPPALLSPQAIQDMLAAYTRASTAATQKTAVTAPLPHAWAPLINTLRKHEALPRSTIVSTLRGYYPDALKTAGIRKGRKYLDAAIAAGIVSTSVRWDGTPEIRLKKPYSL